MTVPTLTQICRLRNLRPATEQRRTKGHLVQLIVTKTSLGAILEQVMVDGIHNIFAPLHGDTGNLRVMSDGTVNSQTHHQQLFNPYPDAYDPDCPESCISYFLSIAEEPRWVNGVMLFPAMTACEFMKEHQDDFFFESKLQHLHSHDIGLFENGLHGTDTANSIHNKLEGQILPYGTTTQVLEYVVDGRNADERATSALEVFDGLAAIFDQRLTDCQIKGGDLRIGGQVHLTILRYLSPENNDLEEFHVIDPRLTLYYNNKQLTKRAKRTVVVGSDSLVRLLYRIFLTEFGNRNGRRTITEFNIHVRVHSRILSEESIRYGLGADFDESLEELVGTPINDIIQRNYELHGYMAAPLQEIPNESDSQESMSITTDEDDGDSIDSSPSSDGDDPPAGQQPGEAPTDNVPPSGMNSDESQPVNGDGDDDNDVPPAEMNSDDDDNDDISPDVGPNEESETHPPHEMADDGVLVPLPNQAEDGVMVELENESTEVAVIELPPVAEEDGLIIDLATEESWERYDNVWYPEWDVLIDAESRRIGLLAIEENLQPNGAALTNEGPNEDEDEQCLICMEDEHLADAVSDSCEHRLCNKCAYNLVTVAPFVAALRDNKHNMYRTGRCPFCRIPGIWTGANRERIGPRGNPIIGYIEQNDTRRGVQLFQWKICEARLWQSLVITTGSANRRPWMLLEGLEIPRREREETCRAFFLNIDGRISFKCSLCEQRLPRRFRVSLNICSELCRNYLMCMRCAIHRQNDDFDTEERRLGRNPANRRYRDQIVLAYRCDACNGRGRLVREDGQHLLGVEGWSRPEVDEILHEIGLLPPLNPPNL
jgi:hypothetical protein